MEPRGHDRFGAGERGQGRRDVPVVVMPTHRGPGARPEASQDPVRGSGIALVAAEAHQGDLPSGVDQVLDQLTDRELVGVALVCQVAAVAEVDHRDQHPHTGGRLRRPAGREQQVRSASHVAERGKRVQRVLVADGDVQSPAEQVLVLGQEAVALPRAEVGVQDEQPLPAGQQFPVVRQRPPPRSALHEDRSADPDGVPRPADQSPAPGGRDPGREAEPAQDGVGTAQHHPGTRVPLVGERTGRAVSTQVVEDRARVALHQGPRQQVVAEVPPVVEADEHLVTSHHGAPRPRDVIEPTSPRTLLQPTA